MHPHNRNLVVDSHAIVSKSATASFFNELLADRDVLITSGGDGLYGVDDQRC